MSGLRRMVCVISGASRGIGQGIAVRFGKAGASVCVLGRSEGATSWGPGTLSDVVKQIHSVGGEGLAVPCDLSQPEQISKAVRTITARTTWPFLTADAGTASFTEAVTKSPSLA